jgi:uncharacterized protein YqcC (DUF446 family)
MKKLHIWSSAEAGEKAASGAFGAGSLTFEEWLQFTFLPNLRKAAATNTLPSNSQVAVAAIRNLDGLQGTDLLIDLLSRVDLLVNRTAESPNRG